MPERTVFLTARTGAATSTAASTVIVDGALSSTLAAATGTMTVGVGVVLDLSQTLAAATMTVAATIGGWGKIARQAGVWTPAR